MISNIKKYIPFLSPIIFLVILLAPTGLEETQQNFLAIFCFVIYNWLFSPISLAISGLLGVSLTVIMGITSAKEALAPLSDPIIYLFFGGFLFARAMSKTGLDTRISLTILSSKLVKGSFHKMVFAILAISTFFSLWVSNTATAAMMLPIVLGTLGSLEIKDKNLTQLLLIAMAYACSIGGLGTPVGSPPNLIALGLLQSIAKVNITFLEWMFYAIPLVIILFFIIYFYVRRFIPEEYKSFDNTYVVNQLAKLPKLKMEEIIIVLVFITTITFWFAPSLLKLALDESNPLIKLSATRLNAGVIAILFSSILFLIPREGRKEMILSQNDFKHIDWSSLILFGTGISLGQTLFSTGLAKLAGDTILYNIAGGHLLLLFLVIVYFTIFATELASNTATANILLPIIIAMALEMNVSPLLLSMASALACSLAFMLPVATPPNAIIYGTGKVELKSMIRVGLGLNFIAGAILVIYFYILSQFI